MIFPKSEAALKILFPQLVLVLFTLVLFSQFSPQFSPAQFPQSHVTTNTERVKACMRFL